MEISDKSRRNMENVAVWKFLGRKLERFVQRTCLPHLREDVRKWAQDLVFHVICRDDRDEPISFRGQHDGKRLDAGRLSSEFYVYLMPRVGAEREGAWNLNGAPQCPGCPEESVFSHLASSPHLGPVATRSLVLTSFSPLLPMPPPRVPAVEFSLLTWFTRSAQIWMSWGRTPNLVRCIFCEITPCICIHCALKLLDSQTRRNPHSLAQHVRAACMHAPVCVPWLRSHQRGWCVTFSRKALPWPLGEAAGPPVSGLPHRVLSVPRRWWRFTEYYTQI